MGCDEFGRYDCMANADICTNPLNSVKDLHEKVCYDESKCMVMYQSNPLLEVRDILDSYILFYEERKRESIKSEVIYDVLVRFKNDLSHLYD